MYSFRTKTSLNKGKPKKPPVFTLPPEVVNFKFVPYVDEKGKLIVDQRETEEEKLQREINELLNKKYKGRSNDFIDDEELKKREKQNRICEHNDENGEHNVISNSSESISNSSDIKHSRVVISDSVSYNYDNVEDETDSMNKPKVNNKKEKSPRKGKRSRKLQSEEHFGEFEDANESFDIQKVCSQRKNNIGDIYEEDIIIDKKEHQENPYRRGAHYCCTYPDRKPNPVTKEMKQKINKQRIFEGKPVYFADTSSDDDEGEFLSPQKHNHKKKMKDPRILNPEIPDLTCDEKVASMKRCKAILGTKEIRKAKIEKAKPKKHQENFNSVTVYLPPKRVEQLSIFYPKDKPHNLESEESFLLHPDQPMTPKVRKVNNKLFESSIHFVDFDDKNDDRKYFKKKNVSKTPEPIKQRSQHVQFDLRNAQNIKENNIPEKNEENAVKEKVDGENEMNSDVNENEIILSDQPSEYYDDDESMSSFEEPKDLSFARRFPRKYLQSLVENNQQ
ncbi:hypothetical protein TRFO_16417 [Tritrichomonas foetus]|uniref:Uncharacterized protein n=1 Tax=Tritrichomonas foetus TaxID=1144522 RepID=A0A1J4KQ64_9EUKA|nr:hypothetical protein TRFO_16417 [Tritrichomonas foetus]|eukprot:OHT13431.1 hypothetical protein TRFO_16417 [Tritrichomonas foetus]